ncbi:MAG: MarR family transcriptional regulator [Candidatus Omnitrophica bacterium]|nr:MarR family transcriptional regulator [Candidatus Omnitrophota bacterium]
MATSIYEELGITPSTKRLSEAALYNLARTFTITHRLFQRWYAAHQLTPAKVNVLMLVKHLGRGQGIPQREIATRLIISGANVTGLIDRLERDGLLARCGAAKDRRVKLITITPKGLAALERLWPAHLERVERVMAALSKREQQQLIALLSKLRERLRDTDRITEEPD